MVTIKVHPLSPKLTKWSNTLKKYTQIYSAVAEELIVFGHFVGLVLKGLIAHVQR